MKVHLACLLIAVVVVQARAREVLVPLTTDPAASNLEIELTVSGMSDTDRTRLTGNLVVAMDCLAPLREVALRDFQLRAATNLNFNLSFAPFGSVVAAMSNFAVAYRPPVPPAAPVPVTNGVALFHEIPARLNGRITYRAQGAPCLALTAAGLSCNGNTNFVNAAVSSQPVVPVQLAVVSNQVQLAMTIEFAEPLDVLGSVTGRAVIRANGPIRPCVELLRAGTNGVLRWSHLFPCHRLERACAASLPNLNWTPVAQMPERVGDLFVVTRPLDRIGACDSAVFFRLICP